MGAPDIRERVSEEVWNTYFKFCVERNPWDKVVSQYYMVRARSNSPGTFENFVSEGRFPVDSPKWYDNESRSFLVDRVLRYERLEKDLRGVFDQLGVPFADGLTTREKTHYRTDRRPFQTYYTTGEMVRAVADRYQLEIELLGYTFDEAADPWTGS